MDKEHVYERIDSMKKFRDFLLSIDEYVFNKRQAFEKRYIGRESEKYENEAAMNQARMGSRFEDVISLINNRIQSRCPFAFVNLKGVEKKPVIAFDFLNEDFEVEGLPSGGKTHGGITSSMTVYGLATRKTGTEFGSVLLVDEWGDVGVYKPYVFNELAKIPQLSFSVFVDVDEDANETEFSPLK